MPKNNNFDGKTSDILYYEIDAAVVMRHFAKEIRVTKPGWQVAEYNPMTWFHDPTKDRVIFKIYIEKKDPT